MEFQDFDFLIFTIPYENFFSEFGQIRQKLPKSKFYTIFIKNVCLFWVKFGQKTMAKNFEVKNVKFLVKIFGFTNFWVKNVPFLGSNFSKFS
jgi:hypothetical protein